MTSPVPAATVRPEVRRGVRVAWALGLAGLLPFFVGAAVLWAGSQRVGPAAYAIPGLLLAYGATIASFLAGVRWGVEVARAGGPSPRNLVLSVTPQLAAWGLAAAPGVPFAGRFDGLAILLIVQGLADMAAKDLPDWYRGLRPPLATGAAAGMIALGAWAHMMAAAHGG